MNSSTNERAPRAIARAVIGTLALGVMAFWAGAERTAAAPQGPSCSAIPSNLVSWWPAEGHSRDIVGPNNGSLVGGMAFTPGLVGEAFNFDGVDDYVSVPASPSLDVGQGSGLTIEMWIYPDLDSTHPLAEWNNGSVFGAHMWQFPQADRLFTNLVDTTGTYHQFSTPSGTLVANQWQHVAVTYDKSTGLATLYRNGVAVIQQNVGVFTPQTSYQFYLGHRPGSGSLNYDRPMDEASVYNRALSLAEIQAIVTADSAGKCAPGCSPAPTSNIVSWYEAEGDARDMVGPNNGTLRNGTTFATGMVGRAFSFDNVDDYVEIAANASIPTGSAARTVELWAYATPASWGDTQNTMFEYGVSGTRTAFGIDFHNFPQIEFYTWGDDLIADSGMTSTTGWMHIAATYDGASTINLYVNGVLRGTKTLGGSLNTSATAVNIGRSGILAGAYFNSLIDETTIFSRVLTASEVLAIYNAGVSGKCSPYFTRGFSAGDPSPTTQGWSVDTPSTAGTWALDGSGFYANTGATSAGWATVSHQSQTFANFDYEVQMARSGTCTSCSNSMWVRGEPSPLVSSLNRWNRGYLFNFNRNGQFSIWRYNGTSVVAVQPWTAAAGGVINTTSGATNTLRVRANGSSLIFIINGTQVASVTDTTFATGKIGMGLARTTSNSGLNDVLRIDLAKASDLGTLFTKAGSYTPLSDEQRLINRQARREYRRNPVGTPEQAPE